MRFQLPYILFWAVLSLLGSANPILAAPYFSYKLDQKVFPARLKVRLQTPEGLHDLRLEQRKYALRRNSSLPILHFQGRVLNTRSSWRAAASIFNGRIALTFFGKRGRRVYRYEGALNASDAESYKLWGVPSSFSLGCAASVRYKPSQSQDSTAPKVAAAFSPVRYIEVSTDADYPFFQAYGSSSNAQIESIINAAEAIYTSQLGLKFELVDQHVFSTSSEPYSSNSAGLLLDDFRSHRESSHHIANADVYHLFTGRTISGGTIGLAYVGAACADNEYSYGLTQKVNSAIQALVFAHEVGHNLSATHPEDPDNCNPPYPNPSLMTCVVEAENNQFSDFSLGQINSHINATDPNKTCLSETLSNGTDLVLTYKNQSGSKAIFSATVSSAEDLSACQLKLFTSTSKSKLSEALLTVQAEQVYSAPFSNNPLKLRAKFGKGTRSKQKALYFRAAIECSEATVSYSPIRRVRPTTFGNSYSLRPAIVRIKNKIGPI